MGPTRINAGQGTERPAQGKRFSISNFPHFMPPNCRTLITNYKRRNKSEVPDVMNYIENNLNKKFKVPSVCLNTLLPLSSKKKSVRRRRRFSTGNCSLLDRHTGNKLFPLQKEPTVWTLFN